MRVARHRCSDTMPAYRFAPDISACRPAGRLVFLDLGGDRYFALSDASDAAISRLIAGSSDPADEALVAPMIERGLLVHGGPGDRPSLCPPITIADTRLSTGRRHWGATARTLFAAWAIVRMRRAIRRRGLKAAIDGVGVARPPSPRASMSALADIVAAFRDTIGILSPLDQCLPRSLALARQLRRAGLAADLIIGVAVQPFRAHCWVQHEDRLLIDDADIVRQFTPILVR